MKLTNALSLNNKVVVRDDLLHLMNYAHNQTGLVFICAPYGFGKTTLLRSYERYLLDAEPGVQSYTHIIWVDEHTESFASLRAYLNELLATQSDYSQTHLFLENIPEFEDAELSEFKQLLDQLLERCMKLSITLVPSQKYVVQDFPDSQLINSHMLTVTKQELQEWAEIYSFTPSFQLINETKGIPLLIAAYGSASLSKGERNEIFQQAVGKVLSTFCRENLPDEVKRLAFMYLLMQKGYNADLEMMGISVQPDVVQILASEYPQFGVDVSQGTFEPVRADDKTVVELAREACEQSAELIELCVLNSIRQGEYERALRLWGYDQSFELALRMVQEDVLGVSEYAPFTFFNTLFAKGESMSEGGEFVDVRLALAGLIFTHRVHDKRLQRRCSAYLSEHSAQLTEQEASFVSALNKLMSFEKTLKYAVSERVGKHNTGVAPPEGLEGLPVPAYQQELFDAMVTCVLDPNPDYAQELALVTLQIDQAACSRYEKRLLRYGAAMAFLYSGMFTQGLAVFMRHQTWHETTSVVQTLLSAEIAALEFFTSIPQAYSKVGLERLSRVSQQLAHLGWRDLSIYAHGAFALCQLPFVESQSERALSRGQACATRRNDTLLEYVFSLATAYLDIQQEEFVRAMIKLNGCVSQFELHGTTYLLELAQYLQTVAQIFLDSKELLEKRLVGAPSCIDKNGRPQVYALLSQIVLLSRLQKTAQAFELANTFRDVLLSAGMRRLVLCTYMIGEFTQHPLQKFLSKDLISQVKEYKAGNLASSQVMSLSADVGADAAVRRNRAIMESPNVHSLNAQALSLESANPTPPIEIKLFGGFELWKNGVLADEKIWIKRKAMSLVALIALHSPREVPRAEIMNELFPEFDFYRARSNLYSILSHARKALGQTPGKGGPDIIVSSRDTLRFNPAYVRTDVGRFTQLSRLLKVDRAKLSPEQILEVCSELERLYRGELATFTADVSMVFETYREQFKVDFLDAMNLAARTAIQADDKMQALYFARIAQRQDPRRDDVVETYMKALAMNFQRAEALEVYYQHMQYLSAELGLSPSPQLLEAYQEVLEGETSFYDDGESLYA